MVFVEKMKKNKKLTAKQKKFVEIKLSNPGLSIRQAAIRAGYATVTADYPQRNITSNHGIIEYANKLGLQLELHGATDELIAKKVIEGFEATKQGYDSSELPDYKTRLDYLKYAGELKGHGTNKTEINNTQNNYNFSWSTPSDATDTTE